MCGPRLSVSIAAMMSIGQTIELEQPFTVRVAHPGDALALRRLAQLDSAPSLSGDVLVAELGDAPLAAISLTTGAVIADPFERSGDAARHLRRRRYQLLRQGGDVGPARQLLRRLVPHAAR